MDWLKINTDVVIRRHELYIAISVIDYCSSLCFVYMEQLVATDPVVGEAFDLAEAMLLAMRRGWGKVLFECDSLLLCKDVNSLEPSSLWAAAGMVEYIRRCLEERREWKVAWVSRWCNVQAHLLVKRAARFWFF